MVPAVLCDFGDRKPQEVVNYIVRRLKELLGTNERQFREYMTMLEIALVPPLLRWNRTAGVLRRGRPMAQSAGGDRA